MRSRSTIWALLITSARGFLQDSKEVAKWYRLSADQGHADVQYEHFAASWQLIPKSVLTLELSQSNRG